MDHIKKINVSLALICLISIRMLFADASFPMAIFGISLTGLYAYSKYLDSKAIKPLDQQVKAELEQMRDTLSGIAVKNNLKPLPKENQRYF
jgi:hypothetical protein